MSMSMVPEQHLGSAAGMGLGGAGAGFVLTEEHMHKRAGIKKVFPTWCYLQDGPGRSPAEACRDEEERRRRLELVGEGERERGRCRVCRKEQEQQAKRKVKQAVLVPDLDVESDSLPYSHNSPPSSPSSTVESSVQNSNPNPALPPRKRA
ncbi:hypothetical protein BT96DRAFT_196310 [Gymnopus androsaceus JB14]|uniref:Uncharacterized protein n=1 Tax=Gymnopus androsaceus JB14 TaxID=1447944 RepID=A0A6A4H8U1_9AGAR|nr:hypothetical protein BT96DRAFT_196310 [Gymnopus androsaceus JB14]